MVTSSESRIMRYPAEKWQKWLFKAPQYLWRMGLRPVLGGIMLMIAHTGRKTGLPRYTMVEYYRIAGRPYVMCAFGLQSQWGRNLLADPRATIQTATTTESVHAVRVRDEDELRQVYETFMARDPFLTKEYLDSIGSAQTPDAFVAHKEAVYCFRFDPTDEDTPPPPRADLIWVWPVLALITVLIFRIGNQRRSR